MNNSASQRPSIRRLNLGAGLDIRTGFDNQDYKKFKGINIVFNLEKFPYPIESNTYDFILCNHIIEHIEDIYKLFDELHRISKPGAVILVEVPHYSTSFAITAIDHKHYFGLDSLGILEKADFQNKTKPFKLISQRILFRGEKSNKIMQLFSRPINCFVNSSKSLQFFVDRFVSKLIPFYFMQYVLRVEKR